MAEPNPDFWAQSTTVNRRIVLNAKARVLVYGPRWSEFIGLLQGKNFGKLIIQLAHK